MKGQQITAAQQILLDKWQASGRCYFIRKHRDGSLTVSMNGLPGVSLETATARIAACIERESK